jgi:hypothetical protein
MLGPEAPGKIQTRPISLQAKFQNGNDEFEIHIQGDFLM